MEGFLSFRLLLIFTSAISCNFIQLTNIGNFYYLWLAKHIMKQLMRLTTFTAALLAAATVISCTETAQTAFSDEHILWYDEPAEIWEETLPLGNGRLGMMPDGGICSERIILNEISMWSGCEMDYANPDAAESLKDIRALLLEGKNAQAQEVMYRRFVPHKPTDGGTYGSYQTLGDLWIDYKGLPETAEEYRRGLDLRTATAFTEIVNGPALHNRKYYVSKDCDAMIIEIEGNPVEFDVRMTREERCCHEISADGMLKISGRLDSGTEKPGMGYAAYADVVTEGKNASVETLACEATDHSCVRNGAPFIRVSGAEKAWIVISAATSFFEGEDYDSKALQTLEAILNDFDADRLHENSVKAHKEFYDRAGVSIVNTAESSKLPTDERLKAYDEGAKDNALAALYYNYGRYLLISSTREGSLPPNLQGLWANTYQTPWNGDYHTNINVQMNHWIAEQGNLSELHLPLTELVLNMIPSGEKTAKYFYGPDAEGWVQHMMTNIWNYTAPGEHPSWGATNTGGAWLCDHLWEHYAYTGDKEYLARIYPALEGASKFFLSTMIKEPKHGYLVTGPTSSPENAFYNDGKAVSICLGPTMDTQLIREIFTQTGAACALLDSIGNKAFIDTLNAAIAQLPPHRISDEGYLMEWMEDYEEVDIHHRHVSHLYGLHPGDQISPNLTPELAEACRVTLNRRGDEATGWSRAWKMNFWARLEDGDRALKLFRSLLHPAYGEDKTVWPASGTYSNLFCSHAPFQIDGNYGGAAGIGEMLIQSHLGFISILPALPAEWPEGNLHGFKAKGGAEIDLSWAEGKPVEMKVTGGWEDCVKIKIPAGLNVSVKGAEHSVCKDFVNLKMKKGQKATVRFI